MTATLFKASAIVSEVGVEKDAFALHIGSRTASCWEESELYLSEYFCENMRTRW